jgi:hypothetical protein
MAQRGTRYWLVKIGRALMAIAGFAFVVDGMLVLWLLSEDRSVLLTHVLNQVRAERVAELDPHLFAPPEEGALVHLVANAVTEGAHDSLSATGRPDLLRLDRHAEMFQWDEDCQGRACSSANYEKRWIGRPVDSSKFHFPRYQNPVMPVTSKTIDAEVQLGPYHVDPELFDDLLGTLPQTPIAPGITPDGYQRADDVLYRSKETDRPELGDLRIKYSGVVMPAATMSVVAVWRDEMLRPLQTANLTSIGLAVPNAVSAADIVTARRQQNRLVVWELRAGAFGVLLLGFGLLYRPLAALPRRLPFLANVVDRGVLHTAPLLSAVVLSATLGLIWLAEEPLIGAGLLVMAAVMPVVVRHRPHMAASATGGFANRLVVNSGGSAARSVDSDNQPTEPSTPRLMRDTWHRVSVVRRRSLHYAGEAIAAIVIVFVLSWFTAFFAALPLIGLATGNLHLAGRGAAVTIHGLWARVISVPMLLVYIGGAVSIPRQTRQRQGEKAMRWMLAAFVIAACLVGLVILGVATDNS